MGSLSWRSLMSRPLQFIASVLAVVLGVAVVSVAFFLRDMMTSAYSGVVDSSTTAQVYVVEQNSSLADTLVLSSRGALLSDKITTEIARLPEVTGVRPLYTGGILLTGKDGEVVDAGVLPSRGVGADLNEVEIEAEQILEGALPTQAGQIALEEDAARKSGLSVGDTTTVAIRGEVTNVTVTGIVDFGASMNGSVLVIVDLLTAKLMYAPSSLVPMIAVKVNDNTPLETAIAAIESVLPEDSGAQVLSGSDLRDQARKDMAGTLNPVSIIVFGIAGLILIVSGYLIANAFELIQRRRAKENAILRALGATPRQVFGAAMVQALIVGLVGSVLGVAIGFGLVIVGHHFLSGAGVQIGSPSLSSSWVGIAISLGVGVVVCLVTAVFSARRAAAASPTDALRGDASSVTYARWVRLAFGLLLVGGGAAALFFASQGYMPLWMLSLGAVAVLIGVLVLGPVILPPIIGAITLPFGGTNGLARAYAMRDSRRAAGMAGVFMVGMALVAGLAILSSSAHESTIKALEKEVRADFVVRTANGSSTVPQTVSDKIRQLALTQVYAFGTSPLTVDLEGAEDTEVWYAPESALSSVIAPDIVSGAVDGFGEGLVVSESFAQQYGLEVGDLLPMIMVKDTPEAVEKELPVALIVRTQIFGDVTVSASWLQTEVPPMLRSTTVTTKEVMIIAADAGQREELERKLEEITDPAYTVEVQTRAEYVAAGGEAIQQFRGALYILLGVSAFVGLLGIASVLGVAVAGSRREFGVLSAMGMTRGRISYAVVTESILVALFGGIVGIIVGSGLAVATQRVFANSWLSHLSVPWVEILALLGVSVVVGLIASLGAAARAARTPVLKVIAQD